MVCFDFGPQRRDHRRGYCSGARAGAGYRERRALLPLTRPLDDGDELVIDGGMIGRHENPLDWFNKYLR